MKWIGRILYIVFVFIVTLLVIQFAQINGLLNYYENEAVIFLAEENYDREAYIERYMTVNIVDTYLKDPVYLVESDDEKFAFDFAIYQLKVADKDDNEFTYLAFYFNEYEFNYEELLNDYEAFEENNRLARIGLEIKVAGNSQVIENYFTIDYKNRLALIMFEQVTNDALENVFDYTMNIEAPEEGLVYQTKEIERITLKLEDFTLSKDQNTDPAETVIANIVSDQNNDLSNVDNLVLENGVLTSTNFNGSINSYLLDELYEDEQLLGSTDYDVLDEYQEKSIRKILGIYFIIVIVITFLLFFLKPLKNHINYKRMEKRRRIKQDEAELNEVDSKEVKIEESKPEIDYKAMTVAELKELAKELGLSKYSNLKKEDLINLIRQNQ